MKIFILTAWLLMPLLSIAQKKNTECGDLRAGNFYYYSAIDNNHYTYIREDNIQKEVHKESGDTSIWRILWKNDCEYRLEYISGNRIFDALEKKEVDQINVLVKVVEVTKEYYRYEAYRPVKQILLTSDTLWRNEQIAKLRRKNIVESSFPGGDKGWNEYLTKVFAEHEKQLQKAKEGIYFVSFVVDTDGSVSEVKAINKQNSVVAKIAVGAILNGPKWKPATKDGVPVKAIKTQPVVFQFAK